MNGVNTFMRAFSYANDITMYAIMNNIMLNSKKTICIMLENDIIIMKLHF